MPEGKEIPPHRRSPAVGFSIAVSDDDETIIESSGLFDSEWYVVNHPAAAKRVGPLRHFCQTGWRRGFQPNPYFDPKWYAKTYSAELRPDENPLLHYIRSGEREDAWPSPHFDPEWYRDAYGLGEHESPLRHYLMHRGAGTHSPLPVFDAVEYTANHPECLAGGGDPYLHSLAHPEQEPELPSFAESPLGVIVDTVGGDLENGALPDSISRDAFVQVLYRLFPFIPFDEAWYCRSYPDVAAAVNCHLISSAHDHFIYSGFFEGRSPTSKGCRRPRIRARRTSICSCRSHAGGQGKRVINYCEFSI